MNEHLETFRSESAKLIDETEEYLLDLENDLNNLELTEAVYRTIHSLKGTAGMFGFNDIEELSHNIEDVYNAIKNNYIVMDAEVINLSFRFLDFVKESISQNPEKEALEKNKGEIISNIRELVDSKEKSEIEENGISTFYILFTPNIDFEERGINLESVFSIIESSTAFKKFEKITPPDQLTEKFYMFWEYVISSDKSITEIFEGILFEENEFEIFKIADLNLFENKEFEKIFQGFEDNQRRYDLSKISELINKFAVENKSTTEAPKKTEKIIIETKEKKEKKLSLNYEVTGINIKSQKLDDLMNMVSELVTNKEAINILLDEIKNEKLKQLAENLEKITRNIQDTALSMRLVPLESIMFKFRRLVRDIAKKQNKKVVFEVDGTETELDKTVINKLAEPLMHIIRNCLDHGIESPEERILKVKQEAGRIKIYASYESNFVIIQIHDDGRGIDAQNIKKIAVKKGLINPGENLSKKDMLDLLFLPGFSTAKKVTDISGRGVGMDVVRKEISDISGELDIDSEVNLGTYVTIKIPLTLSIVDTLQVKINNNNYLIPRNVISSVYDIEENELKKNDKGFVEVNGELVSIFDLRKKFGYKKEEKQNEKPKIVMVLYKERNYGLLVDKIVGGHQAVLKPLGEVFRDKETFSGASILGDSSLALVLDTNKLIKNID